MPDRAKRIELSGQGGFGLVEVMVTAVLIVLITTATVTSIAASQQQSTRTLSRGIVANLAEQDQERMHAFRAEDLVGYTASRTVAQENVNYTVDSTARFVSSDGEEITCNSTGEQTRNLQLSSTVTPPASLRADPLTIKSLHPLPVSQFSPTSGTLVVRVYQADKATGQPNINVALTGPESRSGTTDGNGCIVFQFLKPGSYVGTINQSGFVDPGLNQSVTFSGTVTASTINKASAIYYDRAGSVKVSYDGLPNPGNARGFQVSHGNLNGLTTRPSTTPTLAMGSLFPFPSPYTVYAGACEASSPASWEPTFYTDHPLYGQVTVPAAAQVIALVHEPTINMNVTVKKANAAVVVANSAAQVWQTDAGCATTRWTNNFSLVTGALTSPRHPYGTYTVCAQIDKTAGTGTNGTFSAILTGVQNKSFAGTPSQALEIDTTNTNTTTSRRTCASR